MKTSNKDHDNENFIADSGATSHMVNSEEKITNLKNVETQVTVGDSITITREKLRNWKDYLRDDGKIHGITLSNTAIIPVLYANICSVT